MRRHDDRRKKYEKRSRSRSRSRDRDSSRRRKEHQNQIVVYKERTSPSRFIKEELGNELTDFSLRKTVRDKLNRAKNEERKKEAEKFSFNFQKKENESHLNSFLNQKMIEAIENDTYHSLDEIAKFHKQGNDVSHLNAIYSNEPVIPDKKKIEDAKSQKQKDKKDGFEINDDELFNTFG